MAIQSFVEEIGSAAAPLLAGLIAVSATLHSAILLICLAAWALCAIVLVTATYLVPRDIAALRDEMHRRAERTRAGHTEHVAAEPRPVAGVV